MWLAYRLARALRLLLCEFSLRFCGIFVLMIFFITLLACVSKLGEGGGANFGYDTFNFLSFDESFLQKCGNKDKS